ncbi:MAG: EAL domain-containing protein [Pseudomonadales bacterium]|nr:EAL domain-containing protein [Pseudomonadales bacterium]
MNQQRVLITEDERITALDLQFALEELGFEVVGNVATGEESIQAAREFLPDLILMDIHLKTEMLGTEAADCIVSELDIPVIFLSAYSDRSVIEEAGQTKPYGYLIKPYETRELDAAIQVALAKHSADKKVRDSDRRLTLALEAAKMSVWDWQQEDFELGREGTGSSSLISEAMEILIDRIHPEDRHYLTDDLIANGHLECSLRLKENEASEYRQTQVYASIFSMKNGTKRAIGVARDIHEEYLAREKLKQAAVVFESTSEAILITDSNRRIISTNPAFTEITDFSMAEVLGRDPDDFLHARRNSDHFYPRLLDKGTHFWNGEVACIKRTGGRFPAWEHISGVYGDNGEIINYVFTISDIGDLRRAEKSLARMAFIDSLTGVGNRVHLERSLVNALSSISDGRKIAVLYIDLDGFKAVNDTLGHAEGDRLLQAVAERFTQCVRENDVVTRVGGDEFVIVVTEVNGETGLIVMADKLLKSVSQPFVLASEVVEVSASIGISITNDLINTHETLLTSADTALFHAKRHGKNCYQFYDLELAVESSERLKIERNMKGAFNNQEICVEFQPLINIATNKIYGAEALCRWYSHDMGVIPPDRFIPIAEKSDMILMIGERVLEESCKALNDWAELGLDNVVISVNVSARQLSDKCFPEIVKRTLKKHNISPELIELEITETAIQNNQHAKEQLDILREFGVRFAIDDFGTGYSSLSRLKELPFDRVKIDRSFVTDLLTNESDKEVCRAIFALCDVLHLNVTAEGIENLQQLDLLKDMGCGCAQGFYFGRAMSPDRFAAWVDLYYQRGIEQPI